MVVVEYNTAVKATTIALGTTATLTITNILQMKIMPYLYVSQSIQLLIIVKVELKEPKS